ncbi:MAG: glycoside hydrolase family 97 N-terminal domain-containing protein [Candidatus Marivariicella sp.]
MKSLKSIPFILIFTLIISNRLNAQNLNLKSPNNEIEVTIKTSNNFSFNVKLKNNIVIENVDLGIKMSDGRAIGKNSIVKEAYIRSKNETRNIPVPNKDRKIISKYNELNLKLNKGLEVIFRAYDDGVAYRIKDNKKNRKNIEYEKMDLKLPEGTSTFFSMGGIYVFSQ